LALLAVLRFGPLEVVRDELRARLSIAGLMRDRGSLVSRLSRGVLGTA
jgi:hypothetical protein